MPDEDDICDELPDPWIEHCRLGFAPISRRGVFITAPLRGARLVFVSLHVDLGQSGRAPERVGWRVIVGDCPTDYVTCTGDRRPRSAVEQFAARWRDGAAAMMRSEEPPDWTVGYTENALELAPLLASRSELLVKWGRDDELWP